MTDPSTPALQRPLPLSVRDALHAFADRMGGPALKAAATSWFVVAVVGQLIFVAYVIGFYGRAAMQGRFETWNKVLPHGYVPGDTFGNLVVSLPSHGESAPRTADLHACLVRRAPAGFAVEWRDMACPAIVALLERATGRRAVALVEDECFKGNRSS